MLFQHFCMHLIYFSLPVHNFIKHKLGVWVFFFSADFLIFENFLVFFFYFQPFFSGILPWFHGVFPRFLHVASHTSEPLVSKLLPNLVIRGSFPERNASRCHPCGVHFVVVVRKYSLFTRLERTAVDDSVYFNAWSGIILKRAHINKCEWGWCIWCT